MGLKADHPVAEIDRLLEIVGDEEDRRLRRARDFEHLVLQALARHRVERAERLVHHQRVGLLREAAGDLQPLLHAARHLRRVLLRVSERGRPASASAAIRSRRSPRGVAIASSASETLPAAVRQGSSALE